MSLLWGLLSPDAFSGDLALPQVAVTRGQGRTANVSQQEDGLNLPLRSNIQGQHGSVLLCSRKSIRNLFVDD